jgi:hypothetical protein
VLAKKATVWGSALDATIRPAPSVQLLVVTDEAQGPRPYLIAAVEDYDDWRRGALEPGIHGGINSIGRIVN